MTTFWGIPHNIVAMVYTAADSFFRISPYCIGLTIFLGSYPQCRFFHSSPNCRMILCLTFFDFPMMQLFFGMTGSPDCRLFSIREIPHDVGYLESKSKRDKLKQGKPRGSCVLPHKGGLANYNKRFRDKISPQCKNSMCIFLQQSGEIRKPLIPPKYEIFSGIFLHFYEEMGCIL